MTDTPPPAAPPALSSLRIDRSSLTPMRKRRWGRWMAIALVVAAVAAAALWPRKTEVQLTSVVTAYPSQQYAQLTASGYVVAQRRAAVASKATGRLVELRVREGSVVKKASSSPASTPATSRPVSVPRRPACAWPRPALRQAEAGLRQAQVEQANADAELARSKSLQAQAFVSAQAVDAAQRRADAARASATSAQAAIAQAQASVGQAQAQLKVQRVNEDYAQIRAPFDGVVLVKNANVGDMITPFSSAAGAQGAVVTMADMSTLEVEADVSESNLAKARIGQPVEITLDALPDTRFRGSVVGIVPTVDRAKATVMTKIRFEKLDPRILPEMSAKVTILSQPASDADQQPVLATNPRAVVERDGRKVVFRVKDDTVEAVQVTLGRKLGDSVELQGTLKSGDRLVLSPPAKLATGDRSRWRASERCLEPGPHPHPRPEQGLPARRAGHPRAGRREPRRAGGRVRRADGAQRLGQEHAAEPDRRHRQAQRRPHRDRRHRHRHAERGRAGRLARRQRRLHLPVLQPDAGADRVRERRAAAAADAALARQRKAHVQAALDMVRLTDRVDHYPNELSGGQQQRVAIARALVTDPTLIVADEPTGDLDRVTGEEVLDLLDQLNRELGKTIVMVTHDPKAAARARRLVHLEKGVLVPDEAVAGLG